MPLRDLLFSSKGRIPRSTWWYYRLAVAGVMVGVSIVAVIIATLVNGSFTTNDSSILIGLLVCLGVPAYLFLIVTDIMVSIKRCHDRNRSGWFLLLSYIPSTIYAIFSWLFIVPASSSYGYSPSGMADIALVLNCVLSLVVSGLGLWVLIELGFLKGTSGPNQYGPDPTLPAYMQAAQAGAPAPYGQAGYPPAAGQPGFDQSGLSQAGAIPPGVVPPEIRPPEGGLRTGAIKQCPYCGEAIEEDALFCKYCGRAM